MGFSIKKITGGGTPKISKPISVPSSFNIGAASPAAINPNMNVPQAANSLIDKLHKGLSPGGINPFGAGGGSLGSGDPVGNLLDKNNPYVKKAQANAAAKNAPGPPQPGTPGYTGPGGPGGLTYKSILNTDGTLQDKYKVAASTAKAGQATAPSPFTAQTYNPTSYSASTTSVAGPNQDALNALKSRAMAQGDSPWAALQKQQNELNRTTQMDQAGASALGASDMARSELAMRGGLESGASERIAENSARDLNANRAGIGRAAQSNALNIGISDDQTKMGLLSQLPGIDLANANFNLGQAQFNTGAQNAASQFNAGAANTAGAFNATAANQVGEFNNTQALDLSKFNAGQTTGVNEFNAGMGNAANALNAGNAIHGVTGVNDFNMNQYGINMGAWGAGKQADAIQNSGKK